MRKVLVTMISSIPSISNVGVLLALLVVSRTNAIVLETSAAAPPLPHAVRDTASCNRPRVPAVR